MRVVVTGIGMINALGLNKEEAFAAICAGKSGVGAITQFDASEMSVKIAAEVKGFDPLSVLSVKDVKKADRFIQLGLAAVKEAMTDAEFGEGGFEAEEFGVVSAAGIGGLPNIEKNSNVCLQKGASRISPFFIPSALVNMLGGFTSIEYGLKGPNLSCVTACAAGTHALAEGYKTIFTGSAKKMLVIGAESAICPVGIGGFAAMKALCASRNDEPERASRPFDAARDGFVMGEGAAALVLESYDDAIARGAKIYGELIGFGESADAHHITSPSLDGPLRAMKKALCMAKKTIGMQGGCEGGAGGAGGAGEKLQVDYINAHGTSTPANDKNETAAVKELFGANVPPMSSTKGQTGHCLGAAGAIEAAICLLAMRDGVIPPTINYETQDAECDLDYVPNTARKADLNVVMSNSFGFGGTNASVIFRRV